MPDNGEGRYYVVRNAFDYVVVDGQTHEWMKRFGGTTGRDRAHSYANSLNRHPTETTRKGAMR